MTKTLWQLLSGHKTQVAAVLNLIIVFVVGRDMLQPDAVNLITGLLTLWTVGAVGHGVQKQVKKNPTPT